MALTAYGYPPTPMRSSYFCPVRRLWSPSGNSLLFKGMLVAVLLGCSTLEAVTVTWSGLAGTGAWSATNNWNPAGIPPNGDSLNFDAANANSQFSITLGANRTTAGITFLNTGTNGFTFNAGNTLIINAGGITNNNANDQTFNNAITVNATQTWSAASGNLVFGGALAINNALTLNGPGAHNISVSGATSLAANLTIAATNTGTDSFSNTVTLTANRTITNNGTGSLALGAVTEAGHTLTVAGSGASSITGNITSTGTGKLTYSGTGSLTLSGANTYSGTTTLSGTGKLNLNSNSALGTGTFDITGAATIDNTSASAVTLTNAQSWNSNFTYAGTNDLTLKTGQVELSPTAGLTNVTVTTNGTHILTVASVIDDSTAGGNVSLTKAGTGTLTLSGANTFSGGTILNAGTLNINNNSALGAVGTGGLGTFTINGGTIDNTSASAVTISGLPESWNGNFTFAGTTNNLTLGGSTDPITLGSSITITANAATTQNLTVAGIIGDGGGGLGLTKAGNGTLTLSGANTYGGTTTVNAGTLVATTNASALGTGALALSGGNLALQNDTGLNFGRNTTVSANTTITSDRLTAGAGVTHTLGTLSIGAQTLTVNAGSNVTSGTAGLTFGATTLSNTGTTFSTGTGALLTLASVGGAGNSFTVTGSGNTTITGAVTTTTGAVTKTGTGTLVLGGTNTFTGGLNLNAGTVKVTTNNNLGGAANNLTFNGGTLEVAGLMSTARTLTVGAGSTGTLQIDSGKALTLGTGSVLSAGNTSSILTVNGVDGTGNLILGANQTFSGTLDLANATLSLAGFNLTVGTLDITGNSTIDFGSGSSILSVTNLVLAAGVTLTVDNWNDEKEYFYSTNSPGSQGIPPLNQVVFSGFSGNSTKWMSTDHEITPVPEPSTYGALFTAAALGLFFWFRLKANTPRPVPARVAVRC
jgi:autotransporter-associated beta strand protein